MTRAVHYEAALDTAGAHAVFAVRPLGDAAAPVLRLELALGRESAALLPALAACCAEGGVALAAITRWTVGMGPGSFTGIRVGAALAMGLVAGRDARLRGVPSGLLLARAFPVARGERLAILNDGRRGQAIVARISRPANDFQLDGEAEPLPLDQLAGLAVDRFLVRADDPLAAVLPDRLGPRLRVVHDLDAALLLDSPGFPWPDDPAADAATLDPVYVRPAVFVSPAPPPAVER